MNLQNKSVKYYFLSLLLFISNNTYAVGNYFDLGIHFGGAKVDRIQLAGGNGGTDIGTGDVLSASLGLLMKPLQNTDIQLGIGTRRNTSIGEEGDVTWQSEFLETSLHYHLNNFRIGLGSQYYINPKLRGGTLDRNFDNSTGYFTSVEISLQNSTYAGIRLTHEEYQDSATTENVSGNTVGISLIIAY